MNENLDFDKYELTPVMKAYVQLVLKLQKERKGDHVKFIYPKWYSKKFLSWILIKNDLRFCLSCIIELINYTRIRKYERNKTIELSLWYSFVVTYGKCFAQTTGWVKMEKKLFSSEAGSLLLQTHERIIQLRNRFIAHREDSEYEQIIAFSRINYDLKEGDGLKIETEEIRNEGPSDDEIESYVKVLKYLLDIANNEAEINAQKLDPKVLTDMIDPENWHKLLLPG